jgi:hypothetical protein
MRPGLKVENVWAEPLRVKKGILQELRSGDGSFMVLLKKKQEVSRPKRLS